MGVAFWLRYLVWWVGFVFGLIYFDDFNLIIYYIVGFGLEFCVVLFGFGLLVFVLLFSFVV